MSAPGDKYAASRARLEEALTLLRLISETGRSLTDWEETFVEDLLDKYGSKGYTPTEAQMEKIRQIYADRVW